ncbi:hypothetical protein [Allocoleopsis sp.]|uniref:hypothetical protein n=1 Tax=Allocoleopsis sp. TaxID=3088169 RepID=UPI002FD2947F
MNTLEEIQEIALNMSLTFDEPQSVKLQVKRITFAQKQLRALKKELNATLRDINRQASQSRADSIFSGGLDIFGERKWAGKVRIATRRAMARERQAAQKPYLELKEAIDNFILEGDRLKLMAEEYLLCNQKY